MFSGIVKDEEKTRQLIYNLVSNRMTKKKKEKRGCSEAIGKVL